MGNSYDSNKLIGAAQLPPRISELPPVFPPPRAHPHYFKDVSKLREIDVYRVLKLFEVDDPCIQHAIKKLLKAGKRGAKDAEQDIREAIDSLNRCLQMKAEDCN